ncbi:kinase [Striga asiatica]|uniref:Kinase n=1 Tax=Striga asiatica TaxID=4170 RepID=A0A5A7PDP5_STRAF|nr:kinase [Striga asiatica]
MRGPRLKWTILFALPTSPGANVFSFPYIVGGGGGFEDLFVLFIARYPDKFNLSAFLNNHINGLQSRGANIQLPHTAVEIGLRLALWWVAVVGNGGGRQFGREENREGKRETMGMGNEVFILSMPATSERDDSPLALVWNYTY